MWEKDLSNYLALRFFWTKTTIFLNFPPQAYCVSIVWRCYKYLTLRQQAMRSTVHYILPADGTERIPEPDYSSLLRDQEAAYNHAMKQTPPPSYQDIMDDQPPPYPATVQVIINNPPEVETVADVEENATASTSAVVVVEEEGEKKEEVKKEEENK